MSVVCACECCAWMLRVVLELGEGVLCVGVVRECCVCFACVGVVLVDVVCVWVLCA